MAASNSKTLLEARAAKSKAAEMLGELPVVGVGITRVGGGYGIKVNLSESVAKNAIPKQVDGVPVNVEVVGKIQKQS